MSPRDSKVGFTSLPPEIRSKIYELLPSPRKIHICPPSRYGKKPSKSATLFSLACTCRTAYLEYAPLYYSKAEYTTGSRDCYAVGLWLDAIRPWAGNTIKRFWLSYTDGCRIIGRFVKFKDNGELGEGTPPGWPEMIQKQQKKREQAIREVGNTPHIMVDGLGRKRYKKLRPSRPARAASRRDWEDAVGKTSSSKAKRLRRGRGRGKWTR